MRCESKQEGKRVGKETSVQLPGFDFLVNVENLTLLASISKTSTRSPGVFCFRQ